MLSDKLRLLFSASEAFLPHAATELTRLVSGGAKVERIGADAGILTTGFDSLSSIAELCRTEPCVFVRHLTQVHEILPTGDNAEARLVASLDMLLNTLALSGDVAVQFWSVQGQARSARSLARPAILDHFRARGLNPLRGGCENIIQICEADLGVIVCHGRRGDTLSDWPGGRVKLIRCEERISRSEFKLEEAFQVFDIALPHGGIGVDLGASPGGWTRVLRQRGLRVYAVDPAALDPRLSGDPGIEHFATTAGRFFAERKVEADVVVNDMKMAPELSCELMVALAPGLRAGGLAIVTLKISENKPLARVAQALTTLRKSYEILHARQLFHNRDEVTVAMTPS